MSYIRDQIQENIVKEAIKIGQGIIDVAPRVGKCRIGVKIMENWLAPKTLIVYPDNKIKQSWLDEFEKMDYSNPNITFSSNMSLKKWENDKFDVVFIDECHLLSERNIESVQKLLGINTAVFGLTGTLGEETEKTLRIALKWPVIARYTQEEAIEAGIVSDYRINIIRVPLDNKRLVQYKKKQKTEKQQFNSYTYIIEKLKLEGKNFMFLALARMRVIQGSIAKMEATRKLLKQFKDERVLVFCGLIKVAEQLGIPVQHSKNDGENLEKFSKGEGNHIAVVNMGGAGRTYKPLNKVIINYFNSNEETLKQRINRAMNMEYEGKLAEIYIISSNESVEAKWLEKALTPFDPKKIKYL